MDIIEIESIKPYKKARRIGSGQYAVCYLNKDKEVFKCYKDHLYIRKAVVESNFKDKIIKMDILANDTYKAPKKILLQEGRIVGYICDYVEAKPLRKIKTSERISNMFKNYEQLITDTKDISSKKFLLSDIHECNILYKDGTYKMIDLDNGYFCSDAFTEEEIYRKNIRNIFAKILKKIFGINPHEIPFFYDKEFEMYLHSIDPGNIDEIYNLCEKFAELCKKENPTLREIRKKTLEKKETDGYYYRFL